MINPPDVIFKNVLLSLKKDPEEKIKIRELARVFKESIKTTYTRKSRGSVPFGKILQYCRDNELDASKIFLKTFEQDNVCRSDFRIPSRKVVRIPYFRDVQKFKRK